MQFPLCVTNIRYRLPGRCSLWWGMFSVSEVLVKQTKAMGRNVFAIESVSGELLGTARRTRKLVSDLM